MGKKKSKNNGGGEEAKEEVAQQNNGNSTDETKKEGGADSQKTKNITVVLKVDLHCEGCASKVVKCVRSFDGVEAVKCEGEAHKLTVVGDVDPAKLRDKIEQKTHKKVELISPLPKKENSDGNKKAGNEEKQSNNKKNKNKDNKPKEDKKQKEPPVTTAVMKVHLHCVGCIQKIQKIVTKTNGYQEMNIDKQKDLVTVTGAMDMNALAESLKKHLRKSVEIVPPKKEGEKKEKGGGGGGGKKGKGGGDGGDQKAGNGGSGGGMEGNKMQVQQGYPYPNMYGPGYGGGDYQFQYQYPYGQPYHAPQMFSDENPNACSVM